MMVVLARPVVGQPEDRVRQLEPRVIDVVDHDEHEHGR